MIPFTRTPSEAFLNHKKAVIFSFYMGATIHTILYMLYGFFYRIKYIPACWQTFFMIIQKMITMMDNNLFMNFFPTKLKMIRWKYFIINKTIFSNPLDIFWWKVCKTAWIKTGKILSQCLNDSSNVSGIPVKSYTPIKFLLNAFLDGRSNILMTVFSLFPLSSTFQNN